MSFIESYRPTVTTRSCTLHNVSIASPMSFVSYDYTHLSLDAVVSRERSSIEQLALSYLTPFESM